MVHARNDVHLGFHGVRWIYNYTPGVRVSPHKSLSILCGAIGYIHFLALFEGVSPTKVYAVYVVHCRSWGRRTRRFMYISFEHLVFNFDKTQQSIIVVGISLTKLCNLSDSTSHYS
jgi:hypothetical protein